MSFTSRVNLWQDGIDFALPPGTEALIAVELDGRPNPRQLHIGNSGQPITPTGWVLDVEQLPPIPEFQPGKDLGLFVGTGSLPDEILAQWNGDGHAHTATLKVISSNAFQDVEPMSFEACCDSLFTDVWSVRVSAAMSAGWDGLGIRVPADTPPSASVITKTAFFSRIASMEKPGIWVRRMPARCPCQMNSLLPYQTSKPTVPMD